MKTLILTCMIFFGASFSSTVKPPGLNGPTIRYIDNLESRSLQERSRLGITCSREHRARLRSVLEKVAEQSQVALAATPIRPMGSTRFSGPIFERYFGADNVGARSYVHERMNRIRREALRTPGLPGFGLSRVLILCNEGYGEDKDPCTEFDTLITNQDRSFMVICPLFYEIPLFPSQANELSQTTQLFQALNKCLHPYLREGATDHFLNVGSYTNFINALYLDPQGRYQGSSPAIGGAEADLYFGDPSQEQGTSRQHAQ